MNVLIVEDNPIYQIKLKNFFYEHGYNVVRIIDTVDEAELFFEQKEHYDLVICDVVLGERRVFEIRNWPTKPIIFVTAFEDIEFMKQSLKLENSIFLVKPFADLTLLSVINKFTLISENTPDKFITVFGKHKNPIKVPINEILFVESEGNYSTVVKQNNTKYAIKRSAKVLIEDFLNDFVRVRRSTFVNKNKIARVSISESKVFVEQYSFEVTREFKKNIYDLHYLEK